MSATSGKIIGSIAITTQQQQHRYGPNLFHGPPQPRPAAELPNAYVLSVGLIPSRSRAEHAGGWWLSFTSQYRIKLPKQPALNFEM